MSANDDDILKKVKQWLAYADEDLRLARHGMTLSTDVPHRLIAYHAQQDCGTEEEVTAEEALRAIKLAARVMESVSKVFEGECLDIKGYNDVAPFNAKPKT